MDSYTPKSRRANTAKVIIKIKNMSTFFEKYKDSFGKVQVITEKTTFYHLRKSGFISVSLFNCLEQNGYGLVSDVLNKQPNDICKIPGFGPGKLKELRNFFKYNSELFEIDPHEI